MTRLPRPLHPAAWWLWALGLGAAATRTTNPLLLALVMAVAGYVVVARRSEAPWARSYGVFLKLALVVLVLRLLLAVLFSDPFGTHVLVQLPQLPLPDWMAGVRIGGDITAEALAFAGYDGLRLAALLVCVGAANSLASPAQLLKALPTALYEVGVVITVAASFAPQAVTSLGRIREARRLRGRRSRGLRAVRGLALPVLEGALERSVDLAAAMDSRGFGRRGAASTAQRRLSAVLVLTGLLAAIGSLYGLLTSGTPRALGLPLLVTGCLVAAAGMVVGSRGSARTRYRPDPWRWPEWVVAASGVAAALAVSLGDATGRFPSTAPLVAPPLPLWPTVGILIALLPAIAAPPLPRWKPSRAPSETPLQAVAA
ncbi:MAG: energy-coupling factor transport system permease protein [Frankiales bacterium]|nr:energy-coupling factor transport system permease protein [Frankiales bacterium]